jgi:hypothetical protein
MLETHHHGHHYHNWQEQQHCLYNKHYKIEPFHYFKGLPKLVLFYFSDNLVHFLNPDRAKKN